MKKVLFIFLSLLLIIPLAACGSSSSTPSATEQKSAEPAKEQAPAKSSEPEKTSTFPEKPIKMVIPYGPGGATDIIFRLVAAEAEKHLGQPIVPVNMPGAGATVGSRHVKDEKPDGYTILASHDTIATTKLSGVVDYSFEAFEPIALLTKTINMATVHKDSGFKTMQEVATAVKENPGKYKWSMIPGSTSHFFIAQLMQELDISKDDVRLVGYEGTGDEINALLAKETDLAMTNMPSGKGFFDDGSFLPIGVAHDERLAEIPDAPTLQEQGINFTHATNRGLFAPKGTPEEHIKVIESAFEKALQNEELKKKINSELGSVTQFLPHDEYKKFLDELEANLTTLAKEIEFKKN
jgi:tripartite-type tricarboxylate transporter receptor subunit TctC